MANSAAAIKTMTRLNTHNQISKPRNNNRPSVAQFIDSNLFKTVFKSLWQGHEKFVGRFYRMSSCTPDKNAWQPFHRSSHFYSGGPRQEKKALKRRRVRKKRKAQRVPEYYTVSTLNFSTFNKCYREFHQHKIAIIINHFSYTAARLSSSLSGFAWFCRQTPNFVLFLSWH